MEASSKQRDPRAHLLTGAHWEIAGEAGLNALGLPPEPSAMLAERAEARDAAYREVAARLDGDTPATVDDDGNLHAAALTAVPDPPSLTDLRRRVEAMLPRIDLPELVLEVMSWHPGFTEAFTHASGNPARVADLGLSVAAVLCAHAMNVGFGPVTSPGVAALTRGRLHHVDQSYLRFDTLAAADTALVEAQARTRWPRPGAVGWSPERRRAAVRGTGAHHPCPPEREVLRSETRDHWAEHDQRPSRRTCRPGALGHPADSMHAVDVVLRQQGGTVPEAIITGTGSYSDIMCTCSAASTGRSWRTCPIRGCGVWTLPPTTGLWTRPLVAGSMWSGSAGIGGTCAGSRSRSTPAKCPRMRSRA